MMKKIYLTLSVISVFLMSCGGTAKPRVYYPISVNEKGDTTFQVVKGFEGINQNNEKISPDQYAGKAYIVDFFFANCLGICRKMTDEMSNLQTTFKDNSKVNLLSITVDVANDSIPALKQYANKKGILSNKWDLLRPSSQTEATRIAQEIFHVSAFMDSTGTIQHDERFILVDKKGRIRGYYHVSEPERLKQLIKDTETIIGEQ